MSRTEYMRTYRRKYDKKYHNRIIQILGGQCCRCHTTTSLEIHHKTPIKTLSGRGHHNRVLEWVRAIHTTPTNIILLCSTCHKQIHRRG